MGRSGPGVACVADVADDRARRYFIADIESLSVAVEMSVVVGAAARAGDEDRIASDAGIADANHEAPRCRRDRSPFPCEDVLPLMVAPARTGSVPRIRHL